LDGGSLNARIVEIPLDKKMKKTRRDKNRKQEQ